MKTITENVRDLHNYFCSMGHDAQEEAHRLFHVEHLPHLAEVAASQAAHYFSEAAFYGGLLVDAGLS